MHCKKTSQHFVHDPVIVSAPLALDKYLNVVMTGQDLFLGIYENGAIRRNIEFDEIKELPFFATEELIETAKAVNAKQKVRHGTLYKLWGTEIVKIRREEFLQKQSSVELQHDPSEENELEEQSIEKGEEK